MSPQSERAPASPSYWESETFYRGHDVVIVGAGIVGLSAALHLKRREPRCSIVVVDQGQFPCGASTRNAGFACFGSISELIEFQQRGDTNTLHALIAQRWQGLQLLRETIGDNALQFEQRGGFEIFKHGEPAAEECCEKIPFFNDLVRDITGDSVTYRRADQTIGSFGFRGIGTMIENRFEGQLNSGRMMAALLALVAGLGVQVHTNTSVRHIDQSGQGLRLVTNHGVYETKRVILATNAFAKQLFPELDVVPGRGQVMITDPIPSLPVRGTFHYQQGYYYFRNVNDRLLLGGGRNLNFAGEETWELGVTDQIQHALEVLLREVILPHTPFTIAARWSGLMGFGEQIEPIVKALTPQIFCAVRCNGMGVAIGSLTGKRVAELVQMAG